MNNFRELIVWQRSVQFAVLVYDISKQFPDSERYNLTSQMQRSGVSISSNIAEGAGRQSPALFKNFLSIALGSAYEIETQMIISKKLNYINDESYGQLMKEIVEIQRMIFKLHSTL